MILIGRAEMIDSDWSVRETERVATNTGKMTQIKKGVHGAGGVS